MGLLLLAAAACAPRDAATLEGGPARANHGTWVPVELHRSLAFVEVRLQGRPAE